MFPNIFYIQFFEQYNNHRRDLSATVQNALDVVNAADLVSIYILRWIKDHALALMMCMVGS